MNSSISSDITHPGWQGHLSLEFSHHSEATHLSRSQVQAPLKVQRPFYPEGPDVCHLVTLHTAGGIVGGDRLSIDIQLHPSAQTLITTAAATKVYRSNGLEAQQNNHITVAEGACLEWLPQETIVFDGALYRQDMTVELAADAVWLGWDITRFGRSARGEQFLHGTWRSRTQVWQQGQLIWIDPQILQGGSDMLTSPHGLNGGAVVGTLALVGRSLPPEVVEKARLLWDEVQVNRLSGDRSSDIGVTRLMSGLLCRYRGSSTIDVRRWFTNVWNLLRPYYLQRTACKPRVW